MDGDRPQEWFLWCLGSALFANVVASFGINYMAQMLMSLFPLLACISVATFEARQAEVRSAETSAPEQFASAFALAEADLAPSGSEEAQHSFFED